MPETSSSCAWSLVDLPGKQSEIEMSVLGFIRARWDLMNIKVEDDVGFSDDLKVFKASFLLSTHAAAVHGVVGVNMTAGLKPEAKLTVLDEEDARFGRMEDKGTRGEVSGLELCAATGGDVSMRETQRLSHLVEGFKWGEHVGGDRWHESLIIHFLHFGVVSCSDFALGDMVDLPAKFAGHFRAFSDTISARSMAQTSRGRRVPARVSIGTAISG